MRAAVLLALFGLLSIQPVFSQSGTIKGTITGSSGEPLQGATVTLKGTNNGVVSDANGNYQISNVPDNNAVLSIAFVGFITKEVTVGNQTVINVVLDEDTVLDEVVVVGYGTQKKASLTGSVATMNVKEIQGIPTGNLTNALAGRLSGVTIEQAGGGRPGNSAEITIRARGTWNNTSPLYVIDGIVRDSRAFNVLNANDIENVSVLKDAAAATVYGSRAANGVVLVTTKKGKEGKVKIDYAGSVGFGSFTLVPEIETVEQRMMVTNSARMEWRVGYDVNNNPIYKNIYKNGVNANDGYIDANVFTDDEQTYWKEHGGYKSAYDEAYHTPVTNTHSVSLSGGNDKLNYYAGGNYYNETGVFKALNYEKFSVRANAEAKIAKNLVAYLSINADNSVDTRSPGTDDRLKTLFYELKKTTRLQPVKIDGKYIGRGNSMNETSYLAMADGVTGSRGDKYWNTEYTGSLQWNVPWVKGLSAKVSYNRYVRNRHNKEYYQPYMLYAVKVSGTNGHIRLPEIDYEREPTVINANASVNETWENQTNYQLNGFINYDNTFGKHAISAILGYEQFEQFGSWISGSKSGLTVPSLPYLNYGSTDRNTWGLSGLSSENARLSYLGRVNYAFDNRYILDIAFRGDASVKFDPKHRWGFFPSVSAAWRVSEESFFKNNVSFINNLKLRGSVGLTGNDDVGAFQWIDRASIGGSGAYFGGSSNPPASVSFGAIPNPLITWEKSLSYDGGLEAGFLGNMFTLGFDYFFRHTYDILGSQTANLPDTFGGSVSSSNYGIVDSYGIELELGFNKALGSNVSVWAKGNFGWADNKIVEWAEPESVAPHLSRIGKNWDRMEGFLTDGIIHSLTPDGNGTYTITTSTGNTYYNIQDSYADMTEIGSAITSGAYNAYRPSGIFHKDLRHRDANGNLVDGPDGLLSGDDDRTWVIDHFNPPYNYGLLLGGNWKGLSLEVFLQGTAGAKRQLIMRNASSDSWNGVEWRFWSENQFSSIYNPKGTMPAQTNGLSRATHTDFWARNSSFIRLKSVTLTYSIPQKALSKIGVEAASVYVTGYNLALLWNPMKYADPEMRGEEQNYLSGNETWDQQHYKYPQAALNSYPLMRTVTFGINLSF